jgi:outer membrane protein assembly factor BamD (BamD/ComL family)
MSLPDNKRPKMFTVDLNDNVPLGKMTMTANVPGRKLKKFRLQTSLNGEDFTTVTGWPESHVPWNGTLTLSMAKMSGATDRMTLSALRDYMEAGHLRAGNNLVSLPATSLTVAIDKGLNGKASELRVSEKDQYIAHLKGGFYMPSRQVRTFRLKSQAGENARVSVMCFINGEAVTAPTKGEGPMELKRSFGKGVHRIDLFVIAAPAAEPKVDLQWDIPEEPFFATCPAGVFDPTQHPEIAEELARAPATLTAGKDDTEFEVVFPKDDRARVLRVLLEDFELDAPAITKIVLTDAAGKKVLPTEQDLTLLTKNKVLEIIPGDRITIRYDDPKVVTKGKNVHEQYLQATYMNATVTACFPEYGEVRADGQRSVSYVPIRRFQVGDAVAVVIQDADMDVSEKPDKVSFTVKTTGGQPVKLEALETGEHAGVFTCSVFPVAGKPERASEFQVGPSDDVIVAYMDKENHQPGVPWERTAEAEQSVYVDPQIRAYDVTSRLLTEEELTGMTKAPAAVKSTGNTAASDEEDETFQATRGLVATRPVDAVTTNVASALIDGPIFVEVLWPSVALSQRSQVTIFAQTSAGRAKAAPAPNVPFDLAVPGTVRLKTGPRDAGASDLGAGYVDLVVQGDPDALSPLDDGRFCFSIPTVLGEVPAESLAAEDAATKTGKPEALSVRGGDQIFVGFQYKDKEGKEHWLTRSIQLGSDAFFDVMDRRYKEPVLAAYVGEKVYFRVVDKAKHVTMEKDTVTVDVSTTAGGKKAVTLMETYEASGVFKGYITFAHEQEKAAADDAFTMPVAYGDTVTIAYAPREGLPVLSRAVSIYKGADGNVLPFTKRFKDPEIAVQTQFTMAEAFFELAKKHRELGEDSLARREIGQGKKLLEEAIQDYPETGVQAQADYLLANLSLEFADMAANDEIKRRHFLESISRFTDIVANYSDSPYAAKAQFKKALTFEKMGETDQACEEYVKLSYRYPDNELVAETISRLGLYFFNKGKEITDRAKEIQDPIEQEKIRVQSHEVFRTAAEVFGRLSVRFPQHQLSGMSIVLSGQCYMRAEELEKAVTVFKQVVDDSDADKAARAQAMYWCGDAYMRLATGTGKGGAQQLASGEVPLEEAYKMFTRLRWDYPESEWAKYARGRLTEKALASVAASDK